MTYLATTDAPIVLAGVIASTGVLLGYLLFIWWLDRYEREPLWLVGLVFLWGGLIGTCFGACLSLPFVVLAQALTGPDAAGLVGAVVVAPLAEELTKGLVFVPLVLSAHFDNETDGLIYGAAVGLGFAAVENLLYFGAAASGGTGAVLLVIVLRTLFTSLMHCVSSALLGMFIGYARHRSGAARWILWPLLGYGLACLNHATWNGLAMGVGLFADSLLGPALLLMGLVFIPATAALMFGLTQLSLRHEHQVIARFLAAEAARGVLPAAHAQVIPFWTRRRRAGWLPPHVPKEPYVRAATLLAFRHHQLELAAGERRERTTADIERLRAELRRLLAGELPTFTPVRAPPRP